nr:formyltransferase family protein [Desulfovibrio sp. JC010]
MENYCPVHESRNINEPGVLEAMGRHNIDTVIVFGTSFIKGELLSRYKGSMINLHGGDTELYRGLDTHLWAIYHNDFDSVVTTLHLVDENLDTGHIIAKGQINLSNVNTLAELRAENTLLCVELTVSAIAHFEKLGRFVTSKQRSLGRYYSFMPKDLKDVCVRKYNRYRDKL